MAEFNQELEDISDKIRRGEAVSFADAIAAINYQEAHRADRKAQKMGRIRKAIKFILARLAHDHR